MSVISGVGQQQHTDKQRLRLSRGFWIFFVLVVAFVVVAPSDFLLLKQGTLELQAPPWRCFAERGLSADMQLLH